MTSRGRDGAGDLPFTGSVGSTRYEAAFVTGADGVARRVEVLRGLNVATDPQLKNAALEGTLHRLDGGTYLAVPYVFHDPAARKFVLVIPVARSHEELALRAELLQSLSREPEGPLPAYVREGRAVIGIDALQRYLSETAVDPRAKADADAKADAKLEAVVQREERLRDRAEDVTRREDELRARTEELDVQRADAQVREQQLEQRVADVTAREEALADEERALMANKSALQGRERLLEAREAALGTRERELSSREAEFIARIETARESAPMDAAESVMGARGSHAESIEPIEPEGEAGSDGDEFEADSPLPEALAADDEPVAQDAHDEAMEAEEADETEEAEEISAEEIEPEPTSSRLPAAWVARGHDAYAAVIDGEVRFWARGGAELAARIARGNATLALQVDPESALPLALLSITAGSPPERLARTVLDVTRPDDRAVMETLERDFRVRLEVISTGGRSVGSHAVADQGEANARRALEVLAKREAGTDDARRAETDRLLRDGVVTTDGEAFDRAFSDESSLGTAEGVERAVAAYAPLLDASAGERFMLSRGTPSPRIDAFGKRVILAALRCGVALPETLVARALAVGIAPSEKALAARALTAFARTCESGLDAIGRKPSDASRAWRHLLAWADRSGAEISEPARAAVRALFDADDPDAVAVPDPRPAPDAAAIDAMSDEELGRWADHPAVRESIARTMARRDPARFAEALARSLRLCPPATSAELSASLTRAGDALGDIWVELLGSRRAHARVLAGAAVAVIRLRRGLNPLLQRALASDEPEWKVFAWAAGEFGTAAVRAASRIEEGDPERLGWILAHAVRAGAGRDVEKSRSASTKLLAEAATRAVGRVDEARAFDAALRHDGAQTDGERWVSAMLGRLDARPEDAAASS